MKASPLRPLFITLIATTLALAAPAITRGQDAGAKIGRGFANTALGVLEIPICVSDTVQKKGAAVGFTWGFFKGIGMVPVRTVVGVYELLTFYIPAPKDYQPVLQPETPLHYFYPDWRPQTLSTVPTLPAATK